MADAVTSKVIFKGALRYAAIFTNRSDGTGEGDVTKVDISSLINTLGVAPNMVAVEEISFNVSGFNYLTISFDKTVTNEVVEVLRGTGYRSYMEFGGIIPNGDAGTNDILFTTSGTTAGNSYSVELHLRIKNK